MFIGDKLIVTDSLEFAKEHQRRHANVVRRILEILIKEREYADHFIEDTYVGAGRILLKFNITETGIDKLLNNPRDGSSLHFKEKKSKREIEKKEKEEIEKNKVIEKVRQLKEENSINKIIQTSEENETDKKHMQGVKIQKQKKGTKLKPIFSKLEMSYIGDLIIEKILSNHQENKLSVTKESVKNNAYSLFTIAERLFGTWEQAIELCGLDYDDIKKEDNNLLVYYAYKFENLTRQIIERIHKKKITKGFTKQLQPDYVINNGEWADAKLSEWTIYRCDTIQKYEPHCNSLVIIYLRGDKTRDEYITEKTRLVSIYKLLNELPNKTKNSYIKQLDKLWKQIEEKEFENVELEGDPNNPKGYKGVRWVRNRWNSRIKHNGKIYHLGDYMSEMLAAKAYDDYVLKNNLDRQTNFGDNSIFKNKKIKEHNYIGIWYDRSEHRKWNKWVAGITVNGKKTTIGYYATPEEAARAYDDFVVAHGLDRKINFVAIT